MWQNQTAHQSSQIYEFDVHIFALATEVTGKTIIDELEDEIEENEVTIYVRTSSGKTISIKCDKKQKAASTSDEVDRRSAVPRGMTYLVHHGKVMNQKKTIEENNIGTETTIETSLKLLGGMERASRWTHWNQKKIEIKKEVG